MVREGGAGLKHQDEPEGPCELQFAHITEPSRRSQSCNARLALHSNGLTHLIGKFEEEEN